MGIANCYKCKKGLFLKMCCKSTLLFKLYQSFLFELQKKVYFHFVTYDVSDFLATFTCKFISPFQHCILIKMVIKPTGCLTIFLKDFFSIIRVRP